MAKFYQARAWNAAPDNAAAALEQARKEFLAGLAELEGADATTQAIREQLALGRQQWTFFDAALEGAGADKRGLAADVATTSERILDAPQRDYSSRVDRTRRGSAVQSAAP